MENKVLTFGLIVAALAVLVLSLRSPSGVRAQYNTVEVKKTVSVDKKVRSVQENVYFDNIDKSKKLFYIGDTLDFSIAVENTSKDVLENIKIVDSLPANLSLIFHPGTYNKDKNSIEWTIDKLNPAEVKTYNIRVKVAPYKLMGVAKMTNRVEVKTDNFNDSDEASYFLGVASIPATGSNNLIIETVLVLSLGLSGLYFRKFARGY